MDTERPPTPSEHPAATPDAIAAAHQRVLEPTPDLAEAMRRGYEPKDVPLKGLFVFLASLVGTLVVVLFAIYGIMMALVERDRSHDQLGSSATIERPPAYAPLQPSHEHDTHDWQDMITLRQHYQVALGASGTSPTGRRFIPIEQAMTQTVALLVTRPTSAVTQTTELDVPAGSVEGDYGGQAAKRQAERMSAE